jgi:molybdopterin/thiamine biosynthesis adenylyltransferase
MYVFECNPSPIFRLRKARILLIGLQGFGAEICKNIILAGVKAVTVLDSGVVTDEDACSQFLAARDQLGKNVSKRKLQLSTKHRNLILNYVSN